MATPDMTRASDTQDQEGARRPGSRGWFQPTGHPPAEADTPGPDSGEPTAPIPVRAAAPSAPSAEPGEDELPTAEQAPLARPAVPRGDDGDLPDETTAFPRVPPPGTTPKNSPADRPPDITRPQLVLDDTMVDMA